MRFDTWRAVWLFIATVFGLTVYCTILALIITAGLIIH